MKVVVVVVVVRGRDRARDRLLSVPLSSSHALTIFLESFGILFQRYWTDLSPPIHIEISKHEKVVVVVVLLLVVVVVAVVMDARLSTISHHTRTRARKGEVLSSQLGIARGFGESSLTRT